MLMVLNFRSFYQTTVVSQNTEKVSRKKLKHEENGQHGDVRNGGVCCPPESL